MAKKLVKDIETLRKMFESVDDGRKSVAFSLLDEAEFLQKTMEKLKEEIDRDGVQVTMPQGAYSIQRANPCIASYNTCNKNFLSIMKHLSDLLPKEEKTESDSFDSFLNEY